MNKFLLTLSKSTESLIEFNTKRIDDNNYLNMRNRLFSKDIEKKTILIDSNNISTMNDDYDSSDYIVDFGSNEKYPENFKNVIGFRLIKAVIPNCLYQVNTANNSFIMIRKSDPTVKIPVKLLEGTYTITELKNHIQDRLREKLGQPNITVSIDPSNKFVFEIEWAYPITQSPDPEDDYTYRFLWNSSNTNAYRLFGADNMDETDFSNIYPGEDSVNKYMRWYSDNPIDQSLHYVDVVVPEIPHIACKLNSLGQNVIDRIPLFQPAGAVNYYQVPLMNIQVKIIFIRQN